MLALTIVIETWQQYKLKAAQSRFFAAAVACLLISFAIWIPSKSGGPLCYPDSIFQGHAIWHVGTAIAVGLFFLFLISEHQEDTIGMANRGEMNGNSNTESAHVLKTEEPGTDDEGADFSV